MPAEERFPAAVYAETVLAINFRDAQRSFLTPLLEIHYAHLLMLARQQIVPRGVAKLCAEGLDKLDRKAIAAAPYDGKAEDLFFYVEQCLEQLIGAASSGYLHTARSRNDIGITLYRMRLRQELVEVVRHLNGARQALLAMAKQHVHTVMPAYTHTQPAQPITLAHYLLAAVELIGRDEQRLRAAFDTVNRCPMGACAISTTGFPIDRDYTAALLGFDGLQLNSYGAIAATDYVTETAGAVATAMLNLGRVVQDMLLWCTSEFGYLRLSDAWVQISSIMPQKRNPVPFEHVRILASKALAEAQGVLTALHNTPFGDINDSEDDLQPLVFSMTADAIRALRIFGAVMPSCEVNTARMAERANADFLTVTEMADTLVRGDEIGFRDAHRLVSAAVKSLRGHYAPDAMAEAALALAPSVLGRPLKTKREELLRSLDPVHFIATRRIPGGPAPEAVEAAIADAVPHMAGTTQWVKDKSAVLSAYPDALRRACGELRAR